RSGIGLVRDGGRGGTNRDGVAVVAVLDLHHFGDDLLLGDGIAKSQAGQRIGFAQRAANQNVGVILHQREAVVIGKIDVSFVNQEQAGKFSGQVANLRWRNECGRGGVWIAQENGLRIGREERFDGQR